MCARKKSAKNFFIFLTASPAWSRTLNHDPTPTRTSCPAVAFLETAQAGHPPAIPSPQGVCVSPKPWASPSSLVRCATARLGTNTIPQCFLCELYVIGGWALGGRIPGLSTSTWFIGPFLPILGNFCRSASRHHCPLPSSRPTRLAVD